MHGKLDLPKTCPERRLLGKELFMMFHPQAYRDDVGFMMMQSFLSPTPNRALRGTSKRSRESPLGDLSAPSVVDATLGCILGSRLLKCQMIKVTLKRCLDVNWQD